MSPKRPPTKVRAPKVVRAKRGWRVALGAVSQQTVERVVREFGEREIAPKIRELDETGSYDPSIWKTMVR